MKRRILEECMKIAVARIKARNHPRLKSFMHFTFIVQDGRIMGYGVNRVSEPMAGYPEYGMMHSECDAYFSTRFDKSEPWDAVNIRLGMRMTPRMSKPCACCTAFLKRLGCRAVWFTITEGFAKLEL